MSTSDAYRTVAARAAARDAEERSVRWIAWPDRRIYGPGMTAEEAAARHNVYLRSGYSRAGSGAYHHIRVAPESAPGPLWSEVYGARPGVDPWGEAR